MLLYYIIIIISQDHENYHTESLPGLVFWLKILKSSAHFEDV